MRGRYSATAQLLHWVMAALLFATVAIAWVMLAMPRTAPTREDVYTLHKSIGLTLLALVALRLAWRASHPAPPLPEHHAGWERAAATVSHWMLYVVMIGMPISGYLVSAGGGNAITYFGWFTVPGIPKNLAVREAADWVHVAVGQWLLYALVGLHLVATIWHVAVKRDGLLDRMLPAQDGDL